MEYFGDSPINLGKLIEKKSKYQVCNFGLSGTRISDYINRFLFHEGNTNMEKIKKDYKKHIDRKPDHINFI